MREKINPPEPEAARPEYNRCGNNSMTFSNQAKNLEVYCNNKADAVKGLETRINDLLKEKKQAVSDNHLGKRESVKRQVDANWKMSWLMPRRNSTRLSI